MIFPLITCRSNGQCFYYSDFNSWLEKKQPCIISSEHGRCKGILTSVLWGHQSNSQQIISLVNCLWHCYVKLDYQLVGEKNCGLCYYFIFIVRYRNMPCHCSITIFINYDPFRDPIRKCYFLNLVSKKRSTLSLT